MILRSNLIKHGLTKITEFAETPENHNDKILNQVGGIDQKKSESEKQSS